MTYSATIKLKLDGAIKCVEISGDKLSDISQKFEDVVSSHGLGGSSVLPCFVMLNGKKFGEISYNGKVWVDGKVVYNPYV